jgi:hypothetical protein
MSAAQLAAILIDPWSYRIKTTGGKSMCGSRLPKQARQWLLRCHSVAFERKPIVRLALRGKVQQSCSQESSVSKWEDGMGNWAETDLG